MLFDKVIAFDNFSQKIIVIANARTENLREDYDRCVDEINKIIEQLKGALDKLNIQSSDLSLPKKSIVRWLKKQSIIYMKEIFSRLCFQTGLRLIMREVCLMLTECSER